MHSPLSEFVDPTRKKVALLDDNILAYPKWKQLIEELCKLNKPFTFRQGFDIRLINKDFINLINTAKYDKEIFFAFDDIDDRKIVEHKLDLFRSNSKKGVMMYVFCGYDKHGIYNDDFWVNDISGIFQRLAIIGKYKTYPYLMRYIEYEKSPYAGLYKSIAEYCNRPQIFKSMSFYEFCMNHDKRDSRNRYYSSFVVNHPKMMLYIVRIVI